MNYIKHLSGFFDKIINDNTLNPTHISLYIGLFQFWNINRFVNPISITREEVMRISKIYSKATYHKCIKDLNRKGYIVYQPSFNPFKGSLITICDLTIEPKNLQKRSKTVPFNDKVADQNRNNSVNKQGTGYQTGAEQVTEQALVPSINIRNNTNISNNNNTFENIVNLSKKKIFENENEIFLEKNNFNLEPDFSESQKKEKEKSSAKKEKEKLTQSEQTASEKNITQNSAKKEKSSSTDFSKKEATENLQNEVNETDISKIGIPTLQEVTLFFNEKNFPEIEAQKFYNYFSSNGWLVGGKTPMVNWKAAAENWMLNFNKFNPNDTNVPKSNYLSTTTTKDYSEPL